MGAFVRICTAKASRRIVTASSESQGGGKFTERNFFAGKKAKMAAPGTNAVGDSRKRAFGRKANYVKHRRKSDRAG
jgi:hypothetical protein